VTRLPERAPCLALAAFFLLVSGCATLSLPERLVSPDPAVREAAFTAASALSSEQREELVYKKDLMDLCVLMIRGGSFDGTEERAVLAIQQVSPGPGPMIACMRYAEAKDFGKGLTPSLHDRFVELLAGAGAGGAVRLMIELLKSEPPEKELYRRALVKMGPAGVPTVGRLLYAGRPEIQDLGFEMLTEIGAAGLAAHPKVERRYSAIKKLKEEPEKASSAAPVEKKKWKRAPSKKQAAGAGG